MQFYRRNLPHIHPANAQFFITFVLKGSLPKHVTERFKAEKDHLLKLFREKEKSLQENDEYQYKLEKQQFAKIDKFLHEAKNSKHYLKNEEVAEIVKKKIHEFDGSKYKLLSYCIMSNHVHLLIDTNGYTEIVNRTNQKGTTKQYPVTDIMKKIKGSTARNANKVLNLTGQFWTHESYDHYVRNADELHRIIKYIVENPVKAGIITNWKDWQHTYIK